MYKLFTSDDLNSVINTVYSNITLDSESDGITTVAFSSGSNNDVSSSYYNVLNHLFYRNHTDGNFKSTAKGIYYQYSDSIPHTPQHKNKFNDDGILISISSSYFGSKIKPGTFTYTDTSQASSIIIKDDGYGNLYPTNAVITGSGTTSISSSDNYVGNIFYEHGIAIITDTSSFDTNITYTGSGINYSSSFQSTLDIYTKEYSCTMGTNEFNVTYNRSTLINSSSLQSYYDSRGNLDIISGSRGVEWNAINMPVDSSIQHRFRQPSFRPYISKIGLYNDLGELIMVCTLSHPIQKPIEHPLTIKIQMDY